MHSSSFESKMKRPLQRSSGMSCDEVERVTLWRHLVARWWWWLPQVPPGGLAVAEKKGNFIGWKQWKECHWVAKWLVRFVRLRPVDQPIEDSQVYLNGNQISFKNRLNEWIFCSNTQKIIARLANKNEWNLIKRKTSGPLSYLSITWGGEGTDVLSSVVGR